MGEKGQRPPASLGQLLPLPGRCWLESAIRVRRNCRRVAATGSVTSGASSGRATWACHGVPGLGCCSDGGLGVRAVGHRCLITGLRLHVPYRDVARQICRPAAAKELLEASSAAEGCVKGGVSMEDRVEVRDSGRNVWSSASMYRPRITVDLAN